MQDKSCANIHNYHRQKLFNPESWRWRFSSCRTFPANAAIADILKDRKQAGSAATNTSWKILLRNLKKLLFNHEVNNTKVQIRKPFESGIYIVRIYTQEGSTIEKLQIQK